MSLSVLVPYRPDGGQRDKTWEWLSQRWTALVPEAEVIVEADDGGAHPGEFNHPRAINRAAAKATGDVFLVADCDVAFHPSWVEVAHALVRDGVHPWVLPKTYDKLSRGSTDVILSRNPLAPIPPYNVEWSGDSVSWAGLVVVPREGFEAVGGYDERFAWWGADDVCFGLSMDALHGEHHRLAGSAMHLWHPQPKDETYGHPRHAEQDALMRRYTEAAGDAKALRRLRREEALDHEAERALTWSGWA